VISDAVIVEFSEELHSQQSVQTHEEDEEYGHIVNLWTREIGELSTTFGTFYYSKIGYESNG